MLTQSVKASYFCHEFRFLNEKFYIKRSSLQQKSSKALRPISLTLSSYARYLLSLGN